MQCAIERTAHGVNIVCAFNSRLGIAATSRIATWMRRMTSAPSNGDRSALIALPDYGELRKGREKIGVACRREQAIGDEAHHGLSDLEYGLESLTLFSFERSDSSHVSLFLASRGVCIANGFDFQSYLC